MDMSNARDLSALANTAANPTPEIIGEEVEAFIPIAGIGTQLVRVTTEEGVTLGMLLEIVGPDGGVHKFLAPASGAGHVQAALNDFRDAMGKATRGESVEIVDLVFGGGD